MRGLLGAISRGFLLWVVLGSAAAWFLPGAFTWLRPWIVPGLGVIMLGMGLTLRPADFARAWRLRRAVALGVAAQYGVMPAAAALVTAALGLDGEHAIGVMVVAACPGGTASNVIAYLARADVALSVSMTAVSTLLSPIATPLMLQVLAGASVEVPFSAQAGAIARIVVVPVIAGTALRVALERWGAKRALQWTLDAFPAVSVVFIVLIVGCIVGLNRQQVLLGIGTTGMAVVALNAFGLAGGYGVARLFGYSPAVARTVAIEVGMQNSGLGVALAMTFFGAAAALPSALFSVWHNITGPALAQYWGSRPAVAVDGRGGVR